VEKQCRKKVSKPSEKNKGRPGEGSRKGGQGKGKTKSPDRREDQKLPKKGETRGELFWHGSQKDKGARPEKRTCWNLKSEKKRGEGLRKYFDIHQRGKSRIAKEITIVYKLSKAGLKISQEKKAGVGGGGRGLSIYLKRRMSGPRKREMGLYPRSSERREENSRKKSIWSQITEQPAKTGKRDGEGGERGSCIAGELAALESKRNGRRHLRSQSAIHRLGEQTSNGKKRLRKKKAEP